MRIDLHVHTTVSDGLFEPADIFNRALKSGIEILSITDHDAIGAYLALESTAEGSPCRLLPGVEFSTSLEGYEIHVLGYFPSGVPDSLPRFLNEVQASREARIIQGIRNLKKAHINLKHEDVFELKSGEIISRSHVARAMVKHRLVRNFTDAFNTYLGNDVGIFPPSRFSPFKIIEYLKTENAVSVWAHPEIERFDELIGKMAEQGLSGVEVSAKHGGPTAGQYFERVAADFKLCVTFGSDWHGHGVEPLKGFEIERQRVERFLEYFDL